LKILIAPDKFKESLSAKQVASAISRGIIRAVPNAQIELCPMSDGGEGMVETILDFLGGERRRVVVTGPMGEKVKAEYGILQGKTAVIEISSAAGLWMVPVEKRNPMLTTTYGVGELIRDAVNWKVSKIIIGVGGSATNDGGTGIAKALGIRFLDDENRELGFGGQILSRIRRIDTSKMDSNIVNIEVIAACDVVNPLYGKNGAAYVYAPQKGASPDMVKELDNGLRNYASVIKREIRFDVTNIPGVGAAGGIGVGLVSFLGAKLMPGVEIIAEIVGLRDRIKSVDLVVTGEGKIDGQTISGKTLFGVASIAKEIGKPVIAFAGSIEENAISLHDNGILAMFSITGGPISLSESLKKADRMLERTAEEVFRLINLASSMRK